MVRGGLASFAPEDLPEAMLTVRQVARLLALSRATVYKMIDSGELPHVRFSNAVRISLEALRRLQSKRLRTRTRPAAASAPSPEA